MIYIFDLDGTLIDSSGRHIELLKRILFKNNIRGSSYEFLNRYLDYKASGYNTVSFLEKILDLPYEQASVIAKEWIKHIEDEELLLGDVLYPDTIDVLEKIMEDNMIFFVSCRRNKKYAVNECKRLGIDRYAKEIFIIDPEKGANGKTDIFNYILQEYGNEQIIVGDTEVDYLAANRLNLKYYILNRGFRNKRFWDQKGVVSFSNLYGLLGDIDPDPSV